MEFNECFISGDAELMLQQSCGLECRYFQEQSYFHHSTPKEMASKITAKHSVLSVRDIDSYRRTDEVTSRVLLQKEQKVIHNRPRIRSDRDVIRSEPAGESLTRETPRGVKKRRIPEHRLYKTLENQENQQKAKCQKVFMEGINRQSTPISLEPNPSNYFEIKHSTPKGVNDILEEAETEEMLWTGASAKELHRVMSAPQIPGQSEFLEMNKLRHVTSLPQLWIPKYGNRHLHIWQRRLEVLNRRTEKMRKKDEMLKARLQVIQKRASMLADSPVNTPLKRRGERSTSNQCFDKVPVHTARKPRVKKQIVSHPNSVYSCTLAKLIIGSPIHTTWKDGQKCTYV